MSRGLGSGLGALLGEEAMQESAGIARLPIAKIEPRTGQPREDFDEEKLEELAQSIRDHGMIQPITVRPLEDGYYQIIAGERRWRAARLAGLMEVPVNIMDADDRETAELALIENLQREDLNPLEEARGYQKLMDAFGLTQEKVSERVGKSRPVVANALRLLRLPEDVQALLADQSLSLSHARAILGLEDPKKQSEAAKKTVAEGLSVRETTSLVKRLASDKPAAPRKNHRLGPDGVDYVAEVEHELTEKLGRRVRIDAGAKGGSLRLEYYDAQDFEALRKALILMKL